MMPNKVTLLLALFFRFRASWSSDANPSVDCPAETAQAAVDEYVVLLQRSLDMHDASVSVEAADTSQGVQQKQQDTSASVAVADTSQHKEKQREQQEQQQQKQQHERLGGGGTEARTLTAKMELADATSGAHRGKEEVFPSLPPPEEQDRDYIRDDNHAETRARRKKKAQQAAQQAAQAPKQAAQKDVQASETTPAPQSMPATMPEPSSRLSPEDANYVEDQDYVHTVPVGMVLNFNEKFQKDQETFRQAERNESSSLVQRLRFELDLEHARQEADTALRATYVQKGVVEVADAHLTAGAGTAQKAAELHALAEEVYNKTLNGTYGTYVNEEKDDKNVSPEEKGSKARRKVFGRMAAGAKWMLGSNETKKDRSKDPQVMKLRSLALKAEHLEELIAKLSQTLTRSKTVAEAKLANLTSVEEAKVHRADEARKKLAEAATEADETIASTNKIAFGTIEEAESFLMRLLVDPAGELRAAAGPGAKLTVVPFLIAWAAAVSL